MRFYIEGPEQNQSPRLSINGRHSAPRQQIGPFYARLGTVSILPIWERFLAAKSAELGLFPAKPKPQGAVRLIGLDPSLRRMGFGVIDRLGNKLSDIAHSTIKWLWAIKCQLMWLI